MSCHGANAFNPVCQIREAATQATTDAFTNIAGWFGKAAADATTWLWNQIGTATSISLDSPDLTADLAVTAAIATVLCLGLFLIQVITGTLRQEPGALARAAKGLVIALVASVFALAVTKVLLGVVDALSQDVVQYTMNTNMAGLGRQLALANLANGGISNPAVVLLFSVVVLAAVVVVWAAMMIRKMMVIIAAVLTPLAFSGAAADITRSWVRRWIEFMAAMIVSKLLLVIIMMVGISVVEGAGQVTGAGPGQTATQLATGCLILLMGGFAPWVAIKMFHFTGDALHTAHAYAAQAPAGARTLIAAPQKMQAVHSRAASAVSHRGHGGQAGSSQAGQSGGPSRDSSEVIYSKAAQPPTGQGTGNGAPVTGAGNGAFVGGQTTGGSAGVSGGAGGSTAAGGGGAVAAPVVAAAAATVAAAKAAGAAAGQATQTAAPPVAPEASPPPSGTAPQPAPPVRSPDVRPPTKPA